MEDLPLYTRQRGASKPEKNYRQILAEYEKKIAKIRRKRLKEAKKRLKEMKARPGYTAYVKNQINPWLIIRAINEADS